MVIKVRDMTRGGKLSRVHCDMFDYDSAVMSVLGSLSENDEVRLIYNMAVYGIYIYYMYTFLHVYNFTFILYIYTCIYFYMYIFLHVDIYFYM